MLIHDIKEHLVEIETVNNPLKEDYQHLRGEIFKIKTIKSTKDQQCKQCQRFRNKYQKDANRIIQSKEKVS